MKLRVAIYAMTVSAIGLASAVYADGLDNQLNVSLPGPSSVGQAPSFRETVALQDFITNKQPEAASQKDFRPVPAVAPPPPPGPGPGPGP